MRVHISNLYGQPSMSTAMISQNMTTEIAKSLGFNELGIYNYPTSVDTAEEMSKRIDGIIASVSYVSYGDLVILQLPSWNGSEFDLALIHKLKGYKNLKLAIYLHDVIPLQFKSNYYLMGDHIAMFNLADALIVPSTQMKDWLIDEGLTLEKIIIQQMWDHPINFDLPAGQIQKDIQFAGDAEKFDFVKEWTGTIPLTVYSNPPENMGDNQVKFLGWQHDAELVSNLSKGGFGLVWTDNPDIQECFALCNSYKLGTYLAAGIPVVIPENLSNRSIIEENGLGIVVSDLEDAQQVIADMDPNRYYQLRANVKQYNPLIKSGYYTKKLLIDTVHTILAK